MEVLLDTSVQKGVRCLLLLYLFVAKAAADCPKPQGKGNIVLTNEALLMNDFPEGSKVTLECANGYVRENGSGIKTCVDGNWTEPDLACKKKDCGPPKPQPYMSFNISGGTLFGAVVKVVCDKGYRVSGSSYRQCYAPGWAGRGKCEIVTCKKPGEVTNARSSWDSQDNPKYGEIVRYICNDGHTLIGKDNIVCSETGEFDSQPPECKGVTTEDRITPTSTLPAQDSSPTPRAHRDKTITTSATPTVLPSVRGGENILSTEDNSATTSVTSTSASSFQDKHDIAVDTNNDIGYTPAIVSVVCILLVAVIIGFILLKFLLKRKGSTNETAPIC